MVQRENGKLVVLDPTVGPRPAPATLAPRLASLDGIVLGLIDNSKDNSGQMLDYIAAELDKKHHFKEIVRYRKRSAALPPPEEVMADMKARTHAIVTGIGD